MNTGPGQFARTVADPGYAMQLLLKHVLALLRAGRCAGRGLRIFAGWLASPRVSIKLGLAEWGRAAFLAASGGTPVSFMDGVELGKVPSP
jgi:hypothetical protein